MNVLGVSYGYHDASDSLIVDGRVVAASAEERFTRQKHDSNFPAFAIQYCLEQGGGLRAGDVDQVVFHEDPHAKFARVLTTALAPFPRSRLEFVNSTKSWMGKKLWALNTVSSRLDVPADRISYLSHHFSHAVQAFMGSGFDESAILVVDAVGDWASTALFRGRWQDGRPVVERIFEIPFPNSLGLVYSAFTAFLGFNPNDSECSTMALAAFGRPVYVDAVRAIVAELEDGTYRVDQGYFNFANFYTGVVTGRFTRLFGEPRAYAQKLPFRSFGGNGNGAGDLQRFADAAYAVQTVVEERLLALARRLHRDAPSENLCFAGGVSLNCVANRRLLVEGPFTNVYIPPDPGDGGTAVGTALYYDALNEHIDHRAARYDPYLGAQYDETDDIRMFEHVKPEHVGRYLKRGLAPLPGMRFRHQTFANADDLVDEVAARLMRGGIVGWFQGRAEIGPRALGNRSILIRPDDTALALRLSRDVKDRALFRPYAFSIAEEDAPAVLDVAPEHVRFFRWMQYAAPVRSTHWDKVAAALHVDHTTRPQVCGAAQNPRFHRLLTAFGARFGLAALLNTSFNPSGYPIVSTPVEALTMFARTGMDALALGNTLVWKDAN
jgi:carbamoyltransferase